MVDLSLDSFLNIFKKNVKIEDSNEYVELEVNPSDKPAAKIFVKYYAIVKFEDVSPILNDIRSGYTIAFIKAKELREKGGLDELKRTISKIKKSADASEAQVIGVDEDYILVVPNFVKVEKGQILQDQPTTQS
jgi:SepF-like predicted cell division protein (DUF552 family)